MEVIIRKAETKDIEKLIQFQIRMAKETENLLLDEKTVYKGVKKIFTHPELGQYYVACIDDKVVASLLITPEWSDWRNGWIWWIQSVFVEPEFRQKGIYKSMYHDLKQKIENSSNLFGLRLYVDKRNKNAVKVYKQLGMNNEHYELFEWLKYQSYEK